MNTTEAPKPHINLRKVAEVTVSKCDGKRTIAKSGKVFSGYLDIGFKKIKGNRETGDTKTDIYKMVKNSTFAEMFNSLGCNMDSLVFTQDQVVEFCTNHRDKLRTAGHGTFFLLKERGNFLVAYVYFDDDGRLLVRLYAFEYDYVWSADYQPRVIVTQL